MRRNTYREAQMGLRNAASFKVWNTALWVVYHFY